MAQGPQRLSGSRPYKLIPNLTMSQKTRTREITDTIQTPIKSVDPSLEVGDRMTDNAIQNILPARYLLRDDDGNITEEATNLFNRVATNVAKAELEWGDEEDYEKWRSEFTEVMETLQFIPNSPTLMNAGAELQQLSACFVLEPGDSMVFPDETDDHPSIMETAKEAAAIFKSGGGVGYAFHHLRPKGAMVTSTGGVSSGPISFMEIYDTVCATVEQGGKRRGAQMGIMRVDHPDIGRFVTSKRGEDSFTNFNISTGLTDEFVEAVEEDGLYTLYAPTSDFEDPFEAVKHTLYFYDPAYQDNPRSAFDDAEGEVVRENFWRDYADQMQAWDWENEETVPFREKWESRFTEEAIQEGEEFQLPARFIWDMIIDGAHNNGEPGLFYYDETNRQHSFDTSKHPEHSVEATNPCAEQPLSEFEACNLGHINLSLMLKDDASTYQEWEESTDMDFSDVSSKIEMYMHENVDYDRLERVAEAGTRFLDNVVTQSEFPLEEISERVEGQRKIGLGIMGFAQMLFQMGIPYGSDESYAVAKRVMHHIDWYSKQVSHGLAQERGVFEYWDESKFADPMEYPEWFENHVYEDPHDWPDGFPIRNHNTTTIAPTGTTSMLGNTTGGCEPLHNVAFFKNVGEDIQGEVLEANGIDADAVKAEAEEQMRNNEFRGVDDLDVPDEIAEIFVTTGDLSSMQHTQMQRAFQEHTDSGISKTINAPNHATHADVHEAFLHALDRDDDTLGQTIKGLTFYRDGSRNEQVVTTRVDNKLDDDEAVEEAIELLEGTEYNVSMEDEGDLIVINEVSNDE